MHIQPSNHLHYSAKHLQIWLDALTWIHACFTNKRLVAELTVPLRRGRSFINWKQSVGWTSPNVSQQCKRVSLLPQKSEQALPAYDVNHSKSSNLWRPTILKTYQRIDQQISVNIFGIPTSQVWKIGHQLVAQLGSPEVWGMPWPSFQPGTSCGLAPATRHHNNRCGFRAALRGAWDGSHLGVPMCEGEEGEKLGWKRVNLFGWHLSGEKS